MEIRPYSKADEDDLFAMLEREGPEWEDYRGGGAERYKEALQESVTFVALIENKLCGYVRCRDDCGFGIYIYDLLVAASKRGKNIGRALLGKVYLSFPGAPVYIMSDVDEYYIKQGYKRIGSIFEVSAHE